MNIMQNTAGMFLKVMIPSIRGMYDDQLKTGSTG